jgi:hypothetical protein
MPHVPVLLVYVPSLVLIRPLYSTYPRISLPLLPNLHAWFDSQLHFTTSCLPPYLLDFSLSGCSLLS